MCARSICLGGIRAAAAVAIARLAAAAAAAAAAAGLGLLVVPLVFEVFQKNVGKVFTVE